MAKSSKIQFHFSQNGVSKKYHFSAMEREIQLKETCNFIGSVDVGPCPTQPNYCIYNYRFCNGIANCPNGDDESMEICNKFFPPTATLECKMRDTYNLNITIKAVPCDGNYECEFDLDEQNCSLPDSIFPICLAATAIIGSMLAFVMWFFTIRRLPAFNQEQIQLTDDFETLHQTHELKRFMHNAQTFTNAREINKEYISNEMNWHNGSTCEVVCCFKVSI